MVSTDNYDILYSCQHSYRMRDNIDIYRMVNKNHILYNIDKNKKSYNSYKICKNICRNDYIGQKIKIDKYVGRKY